MEDLDNKEFKPVEEALVCVRCGHALVEPKEEDKFDMCDELVTAQYVCPHCGAYHTMYLDPEESEMDDSVANTYHGYPGTCFNCGHHLVWTSDFMRSEVWGDVECDENDDPILECDSLATNLVCPHCNASFEVVDVKTCDELKYPYYQERYSNREQE